jgi:Phospholipase_D-nuclease N-terminal
MSFWESFWDVIWWFLWVFVFVAYLMVLFAIIADLFRDHSLNGWWKAVWIIFLIFVPFLTALVYLIARGEGMARRSAREERQYQVATDEYIRQAAGAGVGVSRAEEIARAKALLDSGSINQEEFEVLKAHALAQPT